MGEIKSTLDIIMEKTGHLTLSKEEKAERERAEVQQRVQGLIQKLLDGALHQQHLKNEIKSLREAHGQTVHSMLVHEICDRLRIDRDMPGLTDLLGQLCDAGRIVAALERFRSDYRQAARQRKDELKAGLERSRHISGSAVTPNLQADAQWAADALRISRAFSDLLRQEKQRLAGSDPGAEKRL